MRNKIKIDRQTKNNSLKQLRREKKEKKINITKENRKIKQKIESKQTPKKTPNLFLKDRKTRERKFYPEKTSPPIPKKKRVVNT